MYSVRSGYRVGKMLAANPSSSGLDDSISWWKELWRLKILSKIRIFMWCACHHWLPTLVYIARRGVPSDGLCPRCHHHPESMSHALWGCSALAKVRDNYLFTKGLQVSEGLHFHDFMLACLKSLSLSNVELLCVIFWSIWYYRN